MKEKESSFFSKELKIAEESPGSNLNVPTNLRRPEKVTENVAVEDPSQGVENWKDIKDFTEASNRGRYQDRVRSTRIQFAWASIILAFCWIFVIIYIILSHAIGHFHIRQFHSILFAVVIMIGFAAISYETCIIMHHRYVRRYREWETYRTKRTHVPRSKSILYYVLKIYNKLKIIIIGKPLQELPCCIGPEQSKSLCRIRGNFCRELAPSLAFSVGPVAGLVSYLLMYFFWYNSPPKVSDFDQLSDSVLITLITSTTVSVLGILGSVMFWLFPKDKTKPKLPDVS